MDYTNPDYTAIFIERSERHEKLKNDKNLLAAAKSYYKDHPEDFITDWGMTSDPRNLADGKLANVPFILWPRQRELVQWMHESWKLKERGIVEKSRDFGVTWLAVGFAVSMWCFYDGFSAGFGSRKEQLVDRLGDMDSIFEKMRFFVAHLPKELLPDGFDLKQHATYMRLLSPNNDSSITGEAGDNIGRGGRKSMYFVDEKAFIEHQELVDAALSANTDCQLDISTFNGSGNLFYQQVEKFRGTRRHFICDWRDDPRKDEVWYAKKCEELPEEIVAQEIDRDPDAANTDSFIMAKWVSASIDAHKKLGFDASGVRTVGFDPADTGDAKAVCSRWGSVINDCNQLTSGDITTALPWAYDFADTHNADIMIYDADGMGAPVMKVDLQTRAAGRTEVRQYRGSGEVQDKAKRSIPKDRDSKKNGDMYLNFRAQSWTWVRDRFKATYDAVQKQQRGELVNANPEDLISISSDGTAYRELQSELSRPKRIWTKNGKLQIESKNEMKKRGVQSPNIADALIMAVSVRSAEPPAKPIRFKVHHPRDRAMGY